MEPIKQEQYSILVVEDDKEIRNICGLDGAVRLVITLGYAKEEDKLRTKKRKDIQELVKAVE